MLLYLTLNTIYPHFGMAYTQENFQESPVRTYFPRHDTFHRMIERAPDFHQSSEAETGESSTETELEFE